MFFSPFYEFFENQLGFYDNRYSFVFKTLFLNGGYNDMGFTLFLIPLGLLALFYFLYKYPYATFWYWLVYILIIALVVGGLTYNFVSLSIAEHLNSADQEVADFSNSLVLKYALLNSGLSLIVSFLYSLALQRVSKIQMHLPF